ncbi:DUF1389 domain-containing protein [Chlamydia pecorum]|uniref:DUF1389 domain-containing protein n=1 Tax=Chlamydia pecorum TaxID=85991 RepID=UPI0003AE3427|nr:DUF1389 domain-containing protein [Chlamydia pecorum]AGW38836.1 hypothetical protein CPE2_0419 [Chlamydia pecorum W73]AGW39761.1 hypothetical protein CPE3_0419 [Chlamydia pecorum P787]
MNPSSAISHSTLHTLESLDRKSPRSISVIVAIASAAILILTGFILLVTCSSPVAYGLGGIFVLAAGAIIATALIAKLIFVKQPQIPEGIFKVIKNTYPYTFYNFVVEQRLTIQELKAVIVALNSRVSLESLPSSLYQKVIKYGEEKLLGYEHLPDLDSLLLKHCPMHWLYRFIDLGKSCPWDETHKSILQKAYSILGPIARTSGSISVFNPLTYAICASMSQQDLSSLKELAMTGNWDKEEVREIRARLYNEVKASWIAKVENNPLYIKRMSRVFDCSTQVGFDRYLLLFSLHNLTWEQVELIRMLSYEEWLWFCSLEFSGQERREFFQIASLGGFLYNYDVLDELSIDYKLNFALLLREEIQNIDAKRKKEPQKQRQALPDVLGKLLPRTYSLFAKAYLSTDFTLYKAMQQAMQRLPKFAYSEVTGKRTQKIRK